MFSILILRCLNLPPLTMLCDIPTEIHSDRQGTRQNACISICEQGNEMRRGTELIAMRLFHSLYKTARYYAC